MNFFKKVLKFDKKVFMAPTTLVKKGLKAVKQNPALASAAAGAVGGPAAAGAISALFGRSRNVPQPLLPEEPPPDSGPSPSGFAPPIPPLVIVGAAALIVGIVIFTGKGKR